MNTKNNKRRQATRESIEAVFAALLQTREITRITVREICERAGINRSTFYANYLDVYDLADTIRDGLEAQVNALYEGDISYNCGLDYLRLFRHIRDNRSLYDTYFKLGYDHRQVVDLGNIGKRQRWVPEEHLDYHVEFHKAGLNAIIKKWLSSGCVETPEEMVRIIEDEYKLR